MICEDNPKYKLEMVEPIDDDIDELIYDAWGMHDPDNISWKNFSNIVLKGKVLTELEKKSIKPNKTFDEWVEIKLHPEYKYEGLYPDRKSIIDFMLFVIGTGYGYENGYLKIELEDYKVTYSGNLFLHQKSPMHGDYISRTSSFLMPYKVDDINNFSYGILIFSDEYYLVDSVFKANAPIKKERVSF